MEYQTHTDIIKCMNFLLTNNINECVGLYKNIDNKDKIIIDIFYYFKINKNIIDYKKNMFLLQKYIHYFYNENPTYFFTKELFFLIKDIYEFKNSDCIYLFIFEKYFNRLELVLFIYYFNYHNIKKYNKGMIVKIFKICKLRRLNFDYFEKYINIHRKQKTIKKWFFLP